MSEMESALESGAGDGQNDAIPAPHDDTTDPRRIFTAEVLGTFFLVFLGCGAAVTTGADVVATGLTFGLVVMLSAVAVGRISGGHFNPAVTVAAATSGRMSWRATPIYFAAQLIGAIVAALFLFVVLKGIPNFDATGHMGQNGFGDQSGSHIHWWGAFLVEMILTAIFVLVILAVTDNRAVYPVVAPIVIGLTLAAIHFVAIPLTGTSVNPARSIGPALFAGGDAIVQLWLFILAPLAGAVIAGAGYAFLFGRDREPVPGSGFSLPTPAPKAAASEGSWRAGEGTSEIPNAMPQRIIQDGWEWDYETQQWKPHHEPPHPPADL